MQHDNGREDQRPWDKFYWADLESDTGLRACSLAAQGLWTRMLCIMARAKIKGYLLDGEKQMKSKTLARLVGESDEAIAALLDELFSHAVYSVSGDGTIYNRRMVREGQLSYVRSEAGKKGGRPKKQSESKPKAGHEKNTKALSVSASAYTSAFKNLWNEWPAIARAKKSYCLAKFTALYKQGKLPDFQKTTRGYFIFLDYQERENNFKQSPMHLATWLNNWEGEKERYLDREGNILKPEPKL